MLKLYLSSLFSNVICLSIHINLQYVYKFKPIKQNDEYRLALFGYFRCFKQILPVTILFAFADLGFCIQHTNHPINVNILLTDTWTLDSRISLRAR